MFNKFDTKNIFKLFLIVLVFSISIVTLKYVGLIQILKKIIRSSFPIFLAIFISFINEAIIKRIEKFIKRKYSVVLIYFLEIIIIGLIIIMIVPTFIEQFRNLINEMPILYNKINTFTNNYEIKFDIKNTLEVYTENILSLLSDFINIIFDISIGFVGGFFLSFDYSRFKEKIKDYLIKNNKIKTYKFLNIFQISIYKYIYCLIIDMLILFILTGVSFYISGLEYPFMFSLIVAICDLIPFFGPFIGGVPAVIMALTKSINFALVILIIIVVSQFIESNITKPFIMKNAIELHPIEGLIGVAIGGSLFGFFGLITSPVVISAIKIYLKVKKEEKS